MKFPKCKHRYEKESTHYCQVATDLAEGVDAEVTDKACEVCIIQLKDRRPNRVTAGLAIHAVTQLPQLPKILDKCKHYLEKVKVEERDLGEGVGTELHDILKTLGFDIEPGCPCLKRIRLMNERGLQWCKKNKPKIKHWLHSELKRRDRRAQNKPQIQQKLTAIRERLAKFGGTSVLINTAIYKYQVKKTFQGK